MTIKPSLLLWMAACLIAVIELESCAIISTRAERESSGIIDADDPALQYIGRFSFADPKRVLFDWPGVCIRARFEGTRCALRLRDHGNEYALVVDQRAPTVLVTDTSEVYTVASGLSDSMPHTITIQKRTEPLVGRGEFMGLILDRGKHLLPPGPRPDRRIEFIGNSITCGYGDEGPDTNCHFSPETENAGMSYAAMSSRALNAECFLISYSGRGVVRNYGDPHTTSQDPMPALYGRTCFFDSTTKWDFSAWIPQAVVINLGTNDFSTEPYPDSLVFQNAYGELIHRVRAQYPGVTMFCVCGPMIGEPCARYIERVVRREQERLKRNTDVYYVQIEKSRLSDADWGCDHHPNILGMSKMADILVPAIRLRMNW